ncbi:MAG: hypothetical protein H7301_08035 [Cryobacterium sp.]|nr:hypothetical protein [Oligoflexia bacterium]
MMGNAIYLLTDVRGLTQRTLNVLGWGVVEGVAFAEIACDKDLPLSV